MSEPGEMKQWTVEPELEGARLDAALVEAFAGWSRSKLQALVKQGAVSLDGTEVRKPGATLLRGMLIAVQLPAPKAAPSADASRLALDVLHEDEDIIVFNKPHGLLTHRTERGGENSLAELARAIYGEFPSAQGEDRPGIVHRLDRETSGVIVLGRTEAALAELMRQFREREVTKTYQALVHGDPRFESDWIESPLGRDERYPDRIAVLDLEEGGRAAETYYEVHERFNGFAHLHASPKTGRTHQIRVHLLSIGHPVVGDRTYRLQRGSAPKLPESARTPRRQMLHSMRLELAHPTSGDKLVFEAPAPHDFTTLLGVLRESV